jgi:hypothetical protein
MLHNKLHPLAMEMDFLSSHRLCKFPYDLEEDKSVKNQQITVFEKIIKITL